MLRTWVLPYARIPPILQYFTHPSSCYLLRRSDNAEAISGPAARNPAVRHRRANGAATTRWASVGTTPLAIPHGIVTPCPLPAQRTMPFRHVFLTPRLSYIDTLCSAYTLLRFLVQACFRSVGVLFRSSRRLRCWRGTTPKLLMDGRRARPPTPPRRQGPSPIEIGRQHPHDNNAQETNVSSSQRNSRSKMVRMTMEEMEMAENCVRRKTKAGIPTGSDLAASPLLRAAQLRGLRSALNVCTHLATYPAAGIIRQQWLRLPHARSKGPAAAVARASPPSGFYQRPLYFPRREHGVQVLRRRNPGSCFDLSLTSWEPTWTCVRTAYVPSKEAAQNVIRKKKTLS